MTETTQRLQASNYAYGDAGEGHMHNLLLPPIIDLARRLKPKTMLDVGCGNGYLATKLSESLPGAAVAGVDPSESGIRHASAAHPDLDLRQGSVYSDPPAEWAGKFDLVVSTEVVEHLYRPQALPEYVLKVLRPGGTVAATTPYHGYLKNLALSLFNKWDFHHTVFWEHGHIKFWSRNTLRQLFEQAGFEYVSFKGIGRMPWLWMTMLMEFRLPASKAASPRS